MSNYRIRGGSSRLLKLASALAVISVLAKLGPARAEDNQSSAGELKKLSLQELMDIEVTSVSKHAEKLSETPSAIQVITSDDIRRSGASSIPESLQLADNLNVAQKNSHDWAISSRGFNTALANKLLVLVDGRAVYTPLYSGVFWDVQDYLLEDINQIEVISGPGGTLWGANAVNGVINITSKSAKDTQGLYVEGGGGNVLQDFGGLRYGGTIASNVFFRVYGKYFDRNDEVFANGADASDSWRRAQGGFRIDAEPSPQNTFTMQGDLYGGREEVTSGGVGNVGGGNVLGRATHTFSDESDMSLQVYYDRTHRSIPTPALVLGGNTFAPSGILYDDLDTFDVDFQHRLALGERNRLIWGLGYRFTHDVVKNAPALGFFPTKLDQNLFSGMIQDEFSLLENLTLTIGTKLEHNDYTDFEVEPSGRLQWSFVTNQTVWTAVSRAVRTPSRIDRDLLQAPPPALGILKGGPNFDSESVIAYELGYRVQLHSTAALSISTFYNQYDNVRSTSITPGTVIPFFFENNLEGETYGFEFTGDYRVREWWRLRAGYTLLKEDIRVKPGKTDLNNAHNEIGDPQQQFSVRSSIDFPKDVELDARLRWVDTLRLNNSGTVGTTPSYFELDLRLGWQIRKNLEVSIVGQNLLHDHHPEYGFSSPTRVEIGRSVYGKVAWEY